MVERDELFQTIYDKMCAIVDDVSAGELTMASVVVVVVEMMKYVEVLKRDGAAIPNAEKKLLVIDAVDLYIERNVEEAQRDTFKTFTNSFLPSIIDGLCALKLHKVVKKWFTSCGAMCGIKCCGKK